jgi:hypothetical protein
MHSRFILILTIFALALSGRFTSLLSAAEKSPRVIAEIERNRIYEGESVLYRVTVENVENPREPTLKGFDDFDVATLGQQSLDQQSIVIINGKRTDNIRRGRQFNFRLTPKRAGEFTLPGPEVEVEGKTIHGREVSLRVIAPQDQDTVRMEISASPAAVYPMQPFKITLTINVKALPDTLAEENPVAVQSDPPLLEIPWADDQRLPDGLSPQANVSQWLGPLQSERGGFSINNLAVEPRSIFALMEERKIGFMPQPEKVRLPDKTGKAATYWQFKFTRTFVPKRVEEYTFGPVSLKGQFAAKVDPDRGVLGENIYAVAKAITVKIKEVPRDGRPDSYLEAVGHFRLSAELTPHKPQVVKTGDPMTLVLSLRGEGSLENATAPDLSKNPSIEKNFKIYDATEQTKDNERKFTYSLRPLTTELKEFPPIEAAYFNPKTEQYETLRTEAVPIEIAKSDKLASRDIVASPNTASQKSKEIETRREGIYANVTDWSRLSNQSIEPRVWASCWGAMLGGYGLFALVVKRARRNNGDTARLRRNSAARVARKMLKQGMQELSLGKNREGVETIESALLNFIADWTNLPAAGMTAAEACRLLESMELSNEIVATVRNNLEQCESMRFGGTQAVEMLRQEAEPTLEGLIKALRSTKKGPVR